MYKFLLFKKNISETFFSSKLPYEIIIEQEKINLKRKIKKEELGLNPRRHEICEFVYKIHELEYSSQWR